MQFLHETGPLGKYDACLMKRDREPIRETGSRTHGGAWHDNVQRLLAQAGVV